MYSSHQHQPVLLTEAIEALQIKADGVYVDLTFGCGGHSRAILAQLGNAGRLIVFDQDLRAQQLAKQLASQDARLQVCEKNFSNLDSSLEALGVHGLVDGVLMDLGISTAQLTDADRGFSFQRAGPLDMRMDQSSGVTVLEFLQNASIPEITQILRDFGDERAAWQIAKAVVAARQYDRLPKTTTEFAQLVSTQVKSREAGQHPATRTFQALRIYINQELSSLETALSKLLKVLRVGAYMAIISFHSKEDRMVKQFIQQHAIAPQALRKLPVLQNFQPQLKALARVRPGITEVKANAASRSAIMRIAQKIAQ